MNEEYQHSRKQHPKKYIKPVRFDIPITCLQCIKTILILMHKYKVRNTKQYRCDHTGDNEEPKSDEQNNRHQCSEHNVWECLCGLLRVCVPYAHVHRISNSPNQCNRHKALNEKDRKCYSDTPHLHLGEVKRTHKTVKSQRSHPFEYTSKRNHPATDDRHRNCSHKIDTDKMPRICFEDANRIFDKCLWITHICSLN